jgi:hypothetical protein
MKKKPKKFILRRQHHLRLDVTIQKEESPCCHADEVADAIIVALIFNSAAMEKTRWTILPRHASNYLDNNIVNT